VLFRPENLFAAVVGLMDGVLTALTLAAGKILAGSSASLTVSLALRIAVGAAVSGAFIFYVAEYARLRKEIVQAEQHLSLRSRGRLAVSHLGRAVMKDAARGALISCALNFLGALCPLLPAALWPQAPWIALIVALGALALLGAGLARVVYGRPLAWAAALALAGLGLVFVGIQIHIV
jgi:predicted membrane protein (TIGR00267 family)